MSLNIPNLERNKFLAPFTTYKIGGLADLFVEVHTIDELVNALSEARRSRIPFFCLVAGLIFYLLTRGFVDWLPVTGQIKLRSSIMEGCWQKVAQ